MTNRLELIKKTAKNLWFQEWLDRGSVHSGTCCGGKGISKKGLDHNFITCDWTQGNIGAWESVQPALDFLNEQGLGEFVYNDGWMD